MLLALVYPVQHMFAVRTSVLAKSPPAALWKVMSDYTTAYKWLGVPGEVYSVTDGSSVGSVRSLGQIDANNPYLEKLTKLDNAGMCLEYEIIKNTEALNMKSYKAGYTIAASDSGSMVSYYCDAECAGLSYPAGEQPPWATKTELEAFLTSAYAEWVANADLLALADEP